MRVGVNQDFGHSAPRQKLLNSSLVVHQISAFGHQELPIHAALSVSTNSYIELSQVQMITPSSSA